MPPMKIKPTPPNPKSQFVSPQRTEYKNIVDNQRFVSYSSTPFLSSVVVVQSVEEKEKKPEPHSKTHDKLTAFEGGNTSIEKEKHSESLLELNYSSTTSPNRLSVQSKSINTFTFTLIGAFTDIRQEDRIPESVVESYGTTSVFHLQFSRCLPPTQAARELTEGGGAERGRRRKPRAGGERGAPREV